jgi:hypothetical protein
MEEKMKRYYVALCVIEQTGDDDDPGVVRNAIKIEAILPPEIAAVFAYEQHSRYLPLIVAAQNLQRKL